MLPADPSTQEVLLLSQLVEQAGTFLAETGGQPRLAWRLPERHPCRGALLADDVVDHGGDAVGCDLGAAAIFPGDGPIFAPWRATMSQKSPPCSTANFCPIGADTGQTGEPR
jgi:hypothetical protein